MKIEIFKGMSLISELPTELMVQVNNFIKEKKVINIQQTSNIVDVGTQKCLIVITVLYED